MAITPMQKIMIVAHQSQAADLLTALQDAGLVQILDAERAMVTKEWPELQLETRKPRDLEELIGRLEKEIRFLDSNAVEPDTDLFNPRIELDGGRYSRIISGSEAVRVLEDAEVTENRLHQLATDRENIKERLNRLHIWRNFTTPVEEIHTLKSSTVFVGLIPTPHFADTQEELANVGAVIEVVGESETLRACIVVVLESQAAEVGKILRNHEFEAVSFEGMEGTPARIMQRSQERLGQIEQEYERLRLHAVELAEKRLDLKVLYDHYFNLLERRNTLAGAPATERAVFFEGWIKRRHYPDLERIVSRFDACSIFPVEPGEGEEPPVEIENPAGVSAFESITRLYGMPAPADVDPTAFLAPFFAVFFGLCTLDAMYGIVMIGVLYWILRKIKAGQKFIRMLMISSVFTTLAGAITGGWCSDAIPLFFPALEGFRQSLILFDPMESPMVFFVLCLVLGYLQIIAGILIAFIHKLRTRQYLSAFMDHGTWLVWLNSLTLLGLSKAGYLPGWVFHVSLTAASVPAVAILLFSEREGAIPFRIGMGCYNLFSTVFYVGDVLSYIRLMALGMVGGGFGMAINKIALDVSGKPYIGWLLAGLIFVGGHLFNIANGTLGAFVHSMRLQFVEFFTKFLTGTGREFDPLRKQYRHISVKE